MKGELNMRKETVARIEAMLEAQGITQRTLRQMINEARAVQTMFADAIAYIDTSDEDAETIEMLEDHAIDNIKRIERLQHYEKKANELFKEILFELNNFDKYEI